MARAIGLFPRYPRVTYNATPWPIMTEWAYLGVLALQFFILSAPVDMAFRHSAVTKHIGLALTVPLAMLHFAGLRIFTGKRKVGFKEVFAATWPFLVLSLIVVSGSLYASRADHITNNFLSMGLYLPFVTIACGMLVSSQAPDKFLRVFFGIWTFAIFLMLPLIIVKQKPYHEEICLITPYAIFILLQLRLGFWRYLLAMVLFLFVIKTAKNTAFLTILLVGGYYLFVCWLPNRGAYRWTSEGFEQVFKILGVCLMIAGATAVVGFLLLHRQRYLPSGNVEYRVHMYGLALKKFVESPAWGSFFTDASSFYFTEYKVAASTQVLPVHSDVIDLLAHGGLLAILLWGSGVLRILWFAFRELLRPLRWNNEYRVYAHTLALSSMAAVVVYSFNPVITAVPTLAYVVWTNLGFLAALAIISRRKRLAAARSEHGSEARTT